MTLAAKTEIAVNTVAHFHEWVDRNELTLDSGEDWILEDFQDEILEDWLAPWREVWTILPEGNAKTTLAGGVALYHADHTPSPWVPIGASSREQSEIMFGQAAGFIERSPSLKRHFRVYEGYRKIKSLRNGGRGIKVYAADARTGDGVIPTLALVDELHRHEDLRLYRLWKGKLGKRDGVIRTISTAGEPGSEFEEQRETIRNLALKREREGCHLRAEGANLVYHEWAVQDPADVRDLEIVKAANPLASITVQYLEEKLNSETLDFGEDWLRFTCNIPARSSNAAIPEATWDAQQTKKKIPKGKPIWCGADFGWLHDTTAITPLYIDGDMRLFGDPEILRPPGGGLMLDVDEVKEAFRRLHARNPIEVVVLDKSRAEDVAQWLEDELGCDVVDHQQGTDAQVAGYDAWMAGLREKKIWHSGHREFRRHVLNAVAKVSVGDKRRFDRPQASRLDARKQPRRVIDALSAAVMVHAVATTAETQIPELISL